MFGIVQNIHHRKRGLFNLIAFMLIAVGLISVAVFAVYKLLPSEAKFTQTDNNGSFSISFTDAAGISATSDNVVVQDGALMLTDDNSGWFITSEVRPASSGGWRGVAIDGFWNQQADVKALYLDCDGNLIPGILGNTEPGIPVGETGQFDITSVPREMTCIKLKFNLSDSAVSGLYPSIERLDVSWMPQTVYGARLSGTPTTSSGNNLVYTFDYSFSYASAENVVIYMPMPTPVDGSYTVAYNQDLSLTFGSASHNGEYTSTGTTVGDVTVPANSVYWSLGTVQAGEAGSVTAQFKTRNGLQNGLKYKTTATVGANQGDLKVSNDAQSVVSSSPNARITKTTSGTVYVASEDIYYVYETRPEITYNLYINNSSTTGVGREALFNPIVTDDLTAIKNVLTTCGVSESNLSNYIKNISNDGVFDATNGVISWGPLVKIAPNSSRSLSFSVDYSPCLGNDTVLNTNVNNIVKLNMDNQTERTDNFVVNLFGLQPTRGAFAKGERGSINAGRNDPLSSTYQIPYGGATTYNLYTVNEGLNRLDDIVMRDKIPDGMEFVNASLPAGADGTIYYYTNNNYTDPKTPPIFDYTNPVSNGWSTSLPSNPSDVKWVAFYVPCLSSTLVSAGGSCQGKPSNVTGNITVRVKNDAYNQNTDPEKQNVCAATELINWGDFAIYNSSTDPSQQEDSDTTTNTTPIAVLQDKEPSTAYTERASLSSGSTITGPDTIGAGEQANYVITIKNESNVDTSNNTEIRIPLPVAAYGNQSRALELIDFTGTSDWALEGSDVVVRPGVIARGATRTYTLTLLAPRGVVSGSQYTVRVVMSTTDINNCGTSTVTRSQNTTITAQPNLLTYKSVDQNLIGNFATPGNEDISYHLNLRSPVGINSNPGATKNTYMVDQIPSRTTFSAAYTTAVSSVSPNRTHNCTDCKVYFASRNNTNLPTSILSGETITHAEITSQFVLGQEVSPGVWQPNGMSAEDVLYVAYFVDDSTTGIFPISSNIWVGLDVKADTSLSPGSIIANAPVTISDQTLQVVANTVRTIVLNDPGLNIEKTASKENVLPDDEFDWYIDYVNSSSADDTVVSVTDTLPIGVELLGVYNTYNQSAVNAGKPSNEQEWINNVEINNNTDGSQNVVIHIVDANGNTAPLDILPPQQGGKIRLRVKTSDSLTTGQLLLNQATGCYQNETVGPYCIQDDNYVEVQTPDLELLKSVSDPNPRLGSEDAYSLVLRNIGALDAENVTITDILPAGLCYVADSTSVTPLSYNLGEPTVQVSGIGNDCANNPTTLKWSFGNLPADDTNVVLRYKVTVENTIGQGNTVNNQATATTTTFEANLTNNTASAELTTPIPDAYINKRASSEVIQPGETYNYFIEYGNNTNERATGIYLVDALPDVDGDELTDITIESVITPNNETIYYYDSNVSGPLSGKNISAGYNFAADSDFKTAITDFDATHPTSPSYPTHIIITSTGKTLGGGVLDYYENAGEIIISAKAVNPYTSQFATLNTEYLNAAYLDQTSLDEDDTNNETSVIVATPAADLAITKTGSTEGAYPGMAAGDNIAYTVEFTNNSTVPICGVYIEDTMPSEIQSFSHNFTNLELTNRTTGQPITPQDSVGVLKDHQIPITYDNSTANKPKWYLGNTNSSSPDYYLNVCLPAYATGTFEIYGMTSDSALDQTELINRIHINQDADPGAERYLTNNDDVSTTYLYKSNLRLIKTATSSGVDKTFNTEDDSTTNTNPNETIRYKLEYTNDGHYTATDSFIQDAIPEGICFVAGSITNLPLGATVKYSNDDGSTWDYQPISSQDCNVTNFMIELGDITAPANAINATASLTPDRGELGYLEETVRTDILAELEIKQISAGDIFTCAIASDDWVYCWGTGTGGRLGDGGAGSSSVPVAVSQGEIPDNHIIKQISSRSGHSCVVAGNKDNDTQDNAYCWGAGGNGQLGDGSASAQWTPVAVDVNGVLSGKTIKQISAGSSYTCAIASDNQAYCWGLNTFGGLGDGSDATRSNPVAVQSGDIPDGHIIKQISAGQTHTCAIVGNDIDETQDQAYCWGLGTGGQLGNGVGSIKYAPVAVDTSGVLSGKTIKQISAGSGHTCAIASDDKAYCWGQGDHGQLGDGLISDRQLSPVAVQPGDIPDGYVVKQISVNRGGNTDGNYDYACVVAGNSTDSSQDQTYCWGRNDYNQLGSNTQSDDQITPVAVNTPGTLSELTIQHVTTGQYHTCAIASNNQAYCWGRGTDGRLGNGSTDNQSTPVAVGKTETRIVVNPETGIQFKADSVSAGSYHACGISEAGEAYCWGRNNSGQLGDGSITNSYFPVAVDTNGVLKDLAVKQISAGQSHTCAIAGDANNNFNDQMYCWGSAAYGRLGNGVTNGIYSSPVSVDSGDIPFSSIIKQVAAGGSHTCAIAGSVENNTNDNAYCWGIDNNGSLGNGFTGNKTIPTAVETSGVLYGLVVKQISVANSVSTVSSAHTCAIAGDAENNLSDQAYCWGLGNYGVLGNGATNSHNFPVAVSQGVIPNGYIMKQISASGSAHACAIAGNPANNINDQAYCWGYGGYGQLGNGSTSPTNTTPVAVSTSDVLNGLIVKNISIGNSHTCVIAGSAENNMNNNAYCWGNGSSGRLGDGSTNTQSVPVVVDITNLLPDNTITQVSAGSEHTCAIDSNNNVYCWGSGSYGQLGNNAMSARQTRPEVVYAGGSLANLSIKQISTGNYHTCAIASDNQAYCWGIDSYGQLGNGPDANRQVTPIAISQGGMPMGYAVKQISVGLYYTCAIASDNQAYCWGYGGSGQLGNGSTVSRSTPTAVSRGEIPLGYIIKQISAGGDANGRHTCAIAGNATDNSQDKAYCWGLNQYGELGDNTTTLQRNTPVAVDTSGVLNGLVIKQVSAGEYHTCAIAGNATDNSQDKAYCWGHNNDGELGDGNPTIDSSTPVAVDTSGVLNGLAIKQVSAGHGYSCAIAGDAEYNFSDKAYCWGDDSYSKLGNDSLIISQSVPVAVGQGTIPTSSVIKQITTGGSHTCAIAGNAEDSFSDQAYCWGQGTHGALGNGLTYTVEYMPVIVSQGNIPTNSIIKQISAGGNSNENYTCAIAGNLDNDTDDQSYCWGYSTSGQLGIIGVLDSPVTSPNGVWVSNLIPTSDVLATTLELPSGATISSYENLYIDQKVGNNNGEYAFNGTANYYLKQMVGNTCSIDNPDAPGISNPVLSTDTYWDTSVLIPANSLPSTTTKWCIVADYNSAGYVNASYHLSYDSPDNPFVTFDTVVSNPSTNIINNTATINTPSNEITKTDNSDLVALNLLTADLSVTKTVDNAYLNPTDTAAGDSTLSYDIVITNNGNSPAVNPKLVDTLPGTYLTYISAAQTGASNGLGGVSNVNFTCSQANNVINCSYLGELPVGHSATITVNASVKNTVSSGNRINNIAEVSSDTLDTNPDNNMDMATTTVLDIPNIYTHKTANQTNVNVAKQFSYTITFGNNGTADAPGWQLEDKLDMELEFISLGIISQDGVSDLDCNYDSSTRSIICETDSGTLAAGASASIEVFVKTVEDYILSELQIEIDNKACATTTVAQTISDDCSTATVKVIPGDGSTISGRVFMDYQRNVIHNAAQSQGIANVEITLTGLDSLEEDITPITTTTNDKGEYTFYNLRPGIYTVTETQPAEYMSTGSRGGYLTLDANGQPEVSPRDGCGSIQGACSDGSTPTTNQITKIVLLEGDFSSENNFGEIQSSIGNFIWRDLNADGKVDNGEPGISGVEVKLYTDTNQNGKYDEGTDTYLATTTSNVIGYYTFADLTYGKYIVVVTDGANKLVHMENTIASSGHETEDNYSKSGAGYAVELSVASPSNMTADFGYASIDPVVVVDKTDNNTNVEIGDNLTYDITVSNTAIDSPTISDVVITDTLPTTLDYTGSSPAGTWNPTTRTITWTISSLAYGSNVEFEVYATVNNTASTVAPNNTITNPVIATHAACSNVGSVCNDEDIDTVVPHDPTLTITKNDGKTEIEAGGQTTYSITVTNTREGSNPATNVVVTDTLPSHLTFNSAPAVGNVPAGQYSSVGHDVTWTIPSVEYGSPITLTLTATVKSTVLSGTIIHNYVSSNHAACPVITGCVDDDDNTVIKHQPNLEIAKTDGETEVEAGDTLTYTITVNNFTSDSFDAENVTVTDTLPNNVRYISSSNDGVHSGEASGGTVVWTIPSVAYGANIIRTVTVVVNDDVDDGDDVINRVTSNHGACWDGNCNATDTDVVILHDPTLTISKTDYREVVEESDEVEYTITVTNTREGSYAANSVLVTDTLPSNATFVSATGNPTSAPAVNQTGNVVWTLPSVANGSPVELKVKVKINSTVSENDEVVNNINLTHTLGCSQINSICSDSDTDIVVLHDPSILIGKDDGIPYLEAGDETTYSIVVTNPIAGSYPVTDVIVTDALPADTTFVSATGALTATPVEGEHGNVVWTIPSVTYEAPITLTVTIKVNDTVRSGSEITNNVSLTHDTCNTGIDAYCEDEDTNTIIKHDPTLAITKTNNQTGVLVAEELSYEIVVANIRDDSNPAIDATVIDVLPGELEFIEASDEGVFNPDSNEITWSNLDLAYGDPITLTIHVRVKDTTEVGSLIDNIAYIEHDACTVNQDVLPNCSANDEDEVLPRDAQLVVTKSDNETKVSPGQELTYSIITANTILGSLPSQDVEVIDTLPEGLEFVSASDDGEYDSASHSVTWTIPSVAYNTPVELIVKARVSDTVIDGQVLDNIVQLTHDDCDLDDSVCEANDENNAVVPPEVPGTGSNLLDGAIPVMILAFGVFVPIIIIFIYQKKRKQTAFNK